MIKIGNKNKLKYYWNNFLGGKAWHDPPNIDMLGNKIERLSKERE